MGAPSGLFYQLTGSGESAEIVSFVLFRRETSADVWTISPMIALKCRNVLKGEGFVSERGSLSGLMHIF